MQKYTKIKKSNFMHTCYVKYNINNKYIYQLQKQIN